ncbi:MAG: pyridoxal-dependent decarboxylase, exosortase A system-associated [Methylococcales bacterium]
MTRPTATHSPITHFSVEDNCLVIGGIKLTRLTQRVGKTPFYAYDRKLITDRVQNLRTLLPPDIRIHYAMKANPMPAVVQHLSSLVDGIDVASAGEMKIALDTPLPAEHVSMAGPGKRPEELASAIAAGITINVESKNELTTIVKKSEDLGCQARIAVRINPSFELKTSGMKMGGGPKQFGVDEECVPGLLDRIRTLDLHFNGFHIFSGSQNLSAESIIDAQKKSIDLAIRLSKNCLQPPHFINIGGGFGIPYFPGDKPLDVGQIGTELAKYLPNFYSAFPEGELVLELGRYLVGEAGIYVSKVIDRKKSRGRVFLITDGGLHHHLAASGNFGQIIRKNYPVDIGNKLLSKETEICNIVGPLCTPLDIIADKMEMAKAEVGDLVVVFQSGAYGLTASPNSFLTQPQAIEILV